MRGNTSAYYENPPYKVKLQAKSDLLQRGSSVFNNKHWALLNQLTTRDFKSIIGPEVSRLCGLGWKPASRYVNLVLNGRYRGLYLLSETVKEGPSRCNISASGYIMECDPYWWTLPTARCTRRTCRIRWLTLLSIPMGRRLMLTRMLTLRIRSTTLRTLCMAGSL